MHSGLCSREIVQQLQLRCSRQIDVGTPVPYRIDLCCCYPCFTCCQTSPLLRINVTDCTVTVKVAKPIGELVGNYMGWQPGFPTSCQLVPTSLQLGSLVGCGLQCSVHIFTKTLVLVGCAVIGLTLLLH